MSENTMPEQIFAGRDHASGPAWWPEWKPFTAEYIRADVAQAQDVKSKFELIQSISKCDLLQHQLDAANARIAELEAAQAWVSVDERLPEPLDDVFVTNGDFVNIGYASKHGAWNVPTWSDGDDITHWMPLPPPPATDVTP